ncbi:MAG: bile acid:sodium symporter [Hyphomicrobiales bacterium]|nr:bile acid:sodium symporter [Hyphomicrobiales bacterium]
MFRRLIPDPFLVALVCVVALAAVLPCYGRGAEVVDTLATFAIALLFFLQGARLAPETVVSGFTHWRLHLLVLACTFVLFPLLGLALHALMPNLLSEPLWIGMLYLCALPSTVQSSIAFTSIGKGNIPAAICSATASNLLGIFITPILVGLLLSTRAGGGVDLTQVGKIVLQLLVPFILGQLLRPKIGAFVLRNKKILSMSDRGSILLVVYSAFSAAVVNGIWQRLGISELLIVLALDMVLLALVLTITTMAARFLGFDKPDEVTIVFCGSKKTLASGVPMANVLFPGPAAGTIILPLMIFHQVQLMVCAALAQRYARVIAARERPTLTEIADAQSPS